MMSHADARKVVLDAAAEKWPGKTLSLGALQLIQATGLLEGEYGAAWNNANNWGAVQPAVDHGQGCPAGTTPGNDSNPATGAYVACLTVYDSPLSGCGGMIKWLTKTPQEETALLAGDNAGLAAAMYRAHYYLGFHPTKAEKATGMSQADADQKNIADRIHWLQNGAMAIAKALNEPVSIGAPNTTPPSGKTPPSSGVGGTLFLGALGLTAGGLLARHVGWWR